MRRLPTLLSRTTPAGTPWPLFLTSPPYVKHRTFLTYPEATLLKWHFEVHYSTQLFRCAKGTTCRDAHCSNHWRVAMPWRPLLIKRAVTRAPAFISLTGAIYSSALKRKRLIFDFVN